VSAIGGIQYWAGQATSTGNKKSVNVTKTGKLSTYRFFQQSLPLAILQRIISFRVAKGRRRSCNHVFIRKEIKKVEMKVGG
jgi:hypothetical protein